MCRALVSLAFLLLITQSSHLHLNRDETKQMLNIADFMKLFLANYRTNKGNEGKKP